MHRNTEDNKFGDWPLQGKDRDDSDAFVRRLIELKAVNDDQVFLCGVEALVSDCCTKSPVVPARNRTGETSLGSLFACLNAVERKIDRMQRAIESMNLCKPSYSTKEIAKLEGVTPSQVRLWIRDGKLRSVADCNRKAGRHHRLIVLDEDYKRFKRAGR